MIFNIKPKVGMYEKYYETPAPHLKNFEIVNVISFNIMTVDTNEVVAHWENPDYKNKKGENNE